MNDQDNYLKFRGKCKELSEAACLADPELTLVRGHYWCPIWNTTEQHWWTVRKDGTIFDPSKLQFPSAGAGDYKPFEGLVQCEQCGQEVKEEDATVDGHHVFCSYECLGRCVGLI